MQVCERVCVSVCPARVGLESGKGGFVYAQRCETGNDMRVLEKSGRGGERRQRHWARASE